METYYGQIRTPNDAIVLFEACRVGLLPRVQRRLSEKERQSIRSGSVFVWDEREAGMRRWTDGKSWSASRVAGSFLNYREMEGKRGGSNFVQPLNTSPSGGSSASGDGRTHDPDGDGFQDGYRYKPDGLVKQSFSITTTQGQHLHLISYYARSSSASQALPQPSSDPNLRHIQPPKGLYPESAVTDGQNMPAVTRSPMVGSYSNSPSHVHAYSAQRASPALSSYGPGYGWPPSPLNTPPAHYSQYSPYSGTPHSSASTPAGQSPAYFGHHGYIHQHPRPPAGPTAFDRAPPPISNHLPPPPPPPPAAPPTSHPGPTSHPYPQTNGHGPAYSHHASYQPPPPPPPPPQNSAPLPSIQNVTNGSFHSSRSSSHDVNRSFELAHPHQSSPPRGLQGPHMSNEWPRAPARDEALALPKYEPRSPAEADKLGMIPSIGALVNGSGQAERLHPADYHHHHPHHNQTNSPPSTSGPFARMPGPPEAFPYSGAPPPRRPSPPSTKKEHGSYDRPANGQDSSMLRQLDRNFGSKK